MRAPSLTRKLVGTLVAGVVLAWLAAAAAGALVVRAELAEALDGALVETAQRLLPLALDAHLAAQAGEPERAERVRRAARVAPHAERIVYQLRDASGRVLLRSHEAPEDPLPAPLAPGFSEAEGLRLYTEAAISGTLFLQVAEPLGHRRDAMRAAGASLLAPLLVLAPLVLLAAHRLVRRSMRPVHALAAELQARDEDHLEPVTRRELPVELLPIAASVDRLLARLEAALASERALARAGAHELRTPLAAALAQAQQLLAELEPGPARERVARIEEQLRRLRRVVGQVLELARAERSPARPAGPTRCAPVLAMILEDLGRAGLPVGRIAVEGAPDELVAAIDPDAFALVLRNLLENALLHSEPGTPVRLVIEPPAALAIENEGPPLVADARSGAGPARREGAGLGLVIARAAARRSGARLELISPLAGRSGGVRARLELPRA